MHNIFMAQCKTALNPLLTYWSYCSLALSHWYTSLQWCHNGHYGIPNQQPHDCLLNRLFRCRSKKTSKLRITGLCAGNSPVTSEFPAQMTSNAENASIWWLHHDQIRHLFHCNTMVDGHRSTWCTTHRCFCLMYVRCFGGTCLMYDVHIPAVSGTWQSVEQYSVLSISRDIFSLKISQKTPHSSPVRVRYDVSFVGS